MEHIPNELHKTKGFELLSFDHVELTKTKLGSKRFTDVGTLGIVFLPEYNRVFLHLGKWEYCLLKRLPVVCSSRTDMKSRYYNFATYTGFYTVRITKIPFPEALQNFETILSYFSRFSYFGEEMPVRDNEVSPDVSFSEENLDLSQSLASSTTTVTSRRTTDPLVVEEFRAGKLKTSQKLKKGLAKFADKLSGRSKRQEQNIRMNQVMDIGELIDVSDGLAPIEHFGKREIEEVIVKSKDVAKKMAIESNSNVEPIERTDMTQSIQVTVRRENGIAFMVTRSEMEILDEIERERELQVAERNIQEEHRAKELAYIEKERELRTMVRQEYEQRRSMEMLSAEERFQIEMDRKDEMILEQARLRDAEFARFEQKERELMAEIEKRLAELRAKEKMTEEERLEFARREKELVESRHRIDIAKKELEMREKSLIKKTQMKEADLAEREKMIGAELSKIKEKEKELKTVVKARIEELKAKAALTEKERIELIEREKEMERFIALKEGERVQIEKEQREAAASAQVLMAELAERQLLTEAEREALIAKEKEIEMQAKTMLAELERKEILTEEERIELEKQQREIKRIAALREMERVEFVRKQREMEVEVVRRETELREKERLTIAEAEELERIRMQLQREAELKEAERMELEARRAKLVEEAGRREAEIMMRQKLTEAELFQIQEKEKELELELEKKLAELRLKEMLTEEERVELQEREKELSKLKEFREVEIKMRKGQMEKLREHESKLLAKNIELIMGHKSMHNELKSMKTELEQPAVAFEESVEKKTVIFEDVSRS